MRLDPHHLTVTARTVMANLGVVKDAELEKKIEEWRRLDKVCSSRVSVAVKNL